MSDYERRLQRLEQQSTIADDRGGALLMEAIRKRSDELLASDEVRNYNGPDISEEELAAQVETLLTSAKLAAAKLKLGKC